MRPLWVLVCASAGCAPGYVTKDTCGWTTVMVGSGEDTADGLSRFSVSDAQAILVGTWSGTMDYYCSSEGGEHASLPLACEDAPPEEPVAIKVTAIDVAYPHEMSAPTADSDPGCEAHTSIPVELSLDVPSGSIGGEDIAVEFVVYGAQAPTKADADVIAEVPPESPLAVYGSTVLLTIRLNGVGSEAYLSDSDGTGPLLGEADPLTGTSVEYLLIDPCT